MVESMYIDFRKLPFLSYKKSLEVIVFIEKYSWKKYTKYDIASIIFTKIKVEPFHFPQKLKNANIEFMSTRLEQSVWCVFIDDLELLLNWNSIELMPSISRLKIVVICNYF